MPQLKLTKEAQGCSESVTLHDSYYVHFTKLKGRLETVSERYDRTGTSRKKVLADFRAQGFLHADELEEQE